MCRRFWADHPIVHAFSLVWCHVMTSSNHGEEALQPQGMHQPSCYGWSLCKTHGAKVTQNRCSFEGCISYSRMKVCVCYRHCSKSIIIYNNPLQGVITELPPIPSCQSINYKDEEELNKGFGGLVA